MREVASVRPQHGRARDAHEPRSPASRTQSGSSAAVLGLYHPTRGKVIGQFVDQPLAPLNTSGRYLNDQADAPGHAEIEEVVSGVRATASANGSSSSRPSIHAVIKNVAAARRQIASAARRPW